MELFYQTPIKDLPGTPLAERLRPENLNEVLGQEKALKQIRAYLSTGRLPNLILWGPPGTGKTTLAQCLSKETNAYFVSLNAVEAGAKMLKEIGDKAREQRHLERRQTLVFVDEIHRFNKAQQDVLLPFVEKGDFILIGATTENPSYELNRALLSRCRLVVLERMSAKDLYQLLLQACQKLNLNLNDLMTKDAAEKLSEWSDGDGRKALLAFEEVQARRTQSETPLTATDLDSLLGEQWIGYDKSSDQHYDVISAFIKSLRGSDADAGLYYLARMLKGGENPLFIARRLVILASEDVGNADPRAISVAIAGAQAVEMIGLPEAAINLAQVVTYLAGAPKSNRSYMGLKKAQEFVEKSGTTEIQKKLRSAKTSEMKAIGYGEGYIYPHDQARAWADQNYWPEDVVPQIFYEPSDFGFEKNLKEHQEWKRGKLPR